MSGSTDGEERQPTLRIEFSLEQASGMVTILGACPLVALDRSDLRAVHDGLEEFVSRNRASETHEVNPSSFKGFGGGDQHGG